MENSSLLLELNDQQRTAVTAPAKNLLVLAGAGSGKTRVLVHRIAWLMEHQQVSPYSVLAVTFTNKAAYEMRARIESLRGMPLASMWVGTFHGLSHRLLRAHAKQANLPETFQIIDSDDQYRLVRRVLRNLELDETKWSPKQAQWYINKCKEEGKRPADCVNEEPGYFTETMVQVYRAYQALCETGGLVDFSELLLRSLELMRQHPSIAQHYQNRFQHILVDEFQDTNSIQYIWLKAFSGSNTYVMAVGDDDQSIYSWRGAKIENIHCFSKDYPDAEIIRLEQNYRSTKTILSAANAVIDNNDNRLGKNLWTTGSSGELITLYAAFNEHDEAHYIISEIRQASAQGSRYEEFAILYRSNAQSRVIEEALINRQIPYRIYGGLKFFERAEIKDALGYLRLLSNRHDDAAFERIINLPTRGIGNSTLTLLRETAREQTISLWQAAHYLIKEKILNSRASNALKIFLDLIAAIAEETDTMPLDEQVQCVLQQSGLLLHYQKDRSEKGLSREENLEELVGAAKQFRPEQADETLTSLATFLAHIALETGENQAETHTQCVQLMTLHAAKGLEFPVVFIAGMEEELFPHRMSIEEPRGLEEERRLCYVGMTRAKQKLYLLYAETRRLHGVEKYNSPSRFIHEIPEQFIRAVRPKTKISQPAIIQAPARTFAARNMSSTTLVDQTLGLRIGQRVQHKKFGTGVILGFEGQGEQTRIQVKFADHGTKWLVYSYANLEVL